jgi:predicted nucleic acid-binding protein
MERVPARRLVERCWELRGNVTIYDASYVALAEALDVPLITADARLGRTPGPRCPIEVIR